MEQKHIKTNILSKYFALSLISIALFFTNCAHTDSRLFVAEKNNLYGYVNVKGDTVVACKYLCSYTDTIVRIGFVGDNSGKIRCFDNKGNMLFYVFNFDNGPDYPSEGYFRIIDSNELFGFANTRGNVVIKPQYKFANPFKDGKAKVTNTGQKITADTISESHWYWASNNWFFISHKGKKLLSK